MPANAITMSSIFRKSVALRPLAGMGTCSLSLLRYTSSGSSPRWFSQSPKLCAGPSQYPQLAGFTNHYAVLGLSNTATEEDIKKAYRSLSKRFHPDMMRNVDSQEYLNSPDRPKFVKIKDSYEHLVHPARRKEFDTAYNRVVQELTRLNAERRAAQRFDRKRLIASNLRLDQPMFLPDGSPVRDYCVVLVLFLPPHVTVGDITRAVADISPVGRLIDTRLMRPSTRKVYHAAFLEFANDDSAQRFGILAGQTRFHVLGQPIWHCKLVQANMEAVHPPPPEATRVVVIDGPRDHKLMTVSAFEEFLDTEFDGMRGRRESCTMGASVKGPGSVTINCAFTTWRKGAQPVHLLLSRHHQELTVSYGRDPCE